VCQISQLLRIRHREAKQGQKKLTQNARELPKNKAPEIAKKSFRPIFGFYPDNHIDELRERTLLLLEDHGVAIEHEKARALLSAAGAVQTSDGKYFRLPRGLVEEALAATPRVVSLYARDQDWDLKLPRAELLLCAPAPVLMGS